MIDRRGFLGGACGLVACLMSHPVRAVLSAADSSAPLPAYWWPRLAAVAGKVNALAGKTVDGFWFITDLHITANRRQSGKALAALTQLAPSIDKTLCGGDLPEAFSSRFESSKAGVDYAIDFYRLFWTEPIEASGQRVYTAKGNHDFTIRLDPTANDGFTYSGAAARAVVMGTKGCRNVVTNPADPEACYYYFDNVDAKIRYVVMDTTDTINPKAKFWAVVYGMHETQMRWVADNAIATLPAGWSVVLMHHIPFAGVVGSDGDVKRFGEFRRFLDAYQNRGTCTLCGKSYDFAQARGRILLDITGHHHAERQTFLNGILHVTEPCDAAYGDYIIGSAPWCGELPRKNGGTVEEQTFDAVQLDPANDLVYFTRVGGGQDRVIHTRARTMKVGEKMQFGVEHLKGALTWGCYDGDRISQQPNPKNRYNPLIRYHNDYATIAADGTLTALKPGPVMVLAMDAHLNKEIFPVTVCG